jgi:cobalamin biosynthesis protein CobT
MSVTNDVAVSILVDFSGSMMGQEIKTALEASYGLAATLDRLGIANEVIGFTTDSMHNGIPSAEMSRRYEEMREFTRDNGRGFRLDQLYIPIMKSFDESLGPRVAERFVAYRAEGVMGATVLGEAVQNAHARLVRRPESGKVLFVMTDGMPGGSGSVDFAAHAKRVVKAIEESPDVDLIGVGIDFDVDWLFAKHFTVSKIADLPGVLMRELSALVFKKVHG